jgi:tRNA nucleotidyltransferase (CCA-adding enzyme)
MNAIGYDILTGELQDPYDGQSAIAYGLIKHTSEKFSEDPLRVLRAVQFASRFGMSVDADTAELCREQDLNEISAERIESEIYKWAKGGRIDMGMIAFERCCFPDDVSDVVRYFYTERIVTDHTVNSVAFLTNFILRKPPMAKASPMVLNLAAIVIAANMNDVEHDGRVHGWLQKNFSESLTVFRNILDTTVKKQVHDILKGFAVLCLNEDFFTAADYCDGYLDPMSLYDAYRKTLDIDWKPVSDEMPLLDKWRFKAPEKLLTGKELVGMGFPPGPQMGEILSMCRELQRRGYITTKEEALTWASKKKS